MAFEKKSFSNIYQRMVADTRQRIPQLTDFEEGSVIRSLYESFAYELAMLYEQMDLVYQAGFVDTADGANLDRVVAVLGIKRNEPDFASGEVLFERDPGSDEAIIIPIGTLVTTEEDENQQPPKKAYLTTAEGKLAEEETSAIVKVQAEVRGRAMSTDAETIVIMPRPVPGIKSVINQAPIRFLGRDRETDEELRERAKHALLASGRASITSIENALLGMPGVHGVRVKEDFLDKTHAHVRHKHGMITVYVDGMIPENAQKLRERIDQVRAAGVYVILKPATAIKVNAVLRIEIDSHISDKEERLRVETEGRKAIQLFIDQLQMGQSLLFSQLTREILQLKGVNDLVDFKITTSGEKGKTYTPEDKRIEARFSERLVPGIIIVASEIKDLPVLMPVHIIFPDNKRDGVKITENVHDFFKNINRDNLKNDFSAKINEFFNQNNQQPTAASTPNPIVSETQQKLKWAIAFNDQSQSDIISLIQNFFEQVTTAAASVKTQLAASLEQPISAIFIRAVKEYFNANTTKLVKTALQQKIQETLAQKPETELRTALKQILNAQLDAFVNEQMLTFPDKTLIEIFKPGLDEVYKQQLNKNQELLDTALAKLNQAFQDSLETERLKVDTRKQPTVDNYNNKRQELRDALNQNQAQLHQLFDTYQQQLNANLQQSLETLETLKEELKTLSKTRLAQILHNDRLEQIVQNTGQLSAYQFGLTMIEAAFHQKILREVSEIKPNFVEKPVASIVFVYSDRVELTGDLRLILSLTATADEKKQAKNAVSQSIQDYLAFLKPEEAVDLIKIRERAEAYKKVQRVEFNQKACGLEKVVGPERESLTARNKGDSLSVESFEKVFLSADFVRVGN
jgi:uncharacterized phage protein gp47/JayE